MSCFITQQICCKYFCAKPCARYLGFIDGWVRHGSCLRPAKEAGTGGEPVVQQGRETIKQAAVVGIMTNWMEGWEGGLGSHRLGDYSNQQVLQTDSRQETTVIGDGEAGFRGCFKEKHLKKVFHRPVNSSGRTAFLVEGTAGKKGKGMGKQRMCSRNTG